MSTLLSAWYDEILPDLKGITPGAFALKLILDAAIEFCQLSKVHRIDHPPIGLVALVSTYAFAPGAGLAVVEPIKVRVNGQSIDPATDDDLDYAYGDDWANGNLTPGAAAFYRCPDDASIQIVPAPSASIVGGLVMRVAVKPTPAAVNVDDRLYNEITYRHAIAARSKAMAMLSPGKPYSNPELGVIHQGEFLRLVGTADINASKGFSRRPLRSGVVDRIK